MAEIEQNTSSGYFRTKQVIINASVYIRSVKERQDKSVCIIVGEKSDVTLTVI